MHSLYTITSNKSKNREILGNSEKLSVYYHDLFDYPLTFADLIKWNPLNDSSQKLHKNQITYKDGYYFVQGREGLIYKRILKSRLSAKKMKIAQKASDALSLIPSVLMVAVTGSLAMGNAGDESDIDLFIITAKNSLWTTRILSYFVLPAFGLNLRRAGDNNQSDKLCLNMWMDEADLAWRWQDRNIYTAHETAQILPLVNKKGIYEKFLRCNRWVLRFWPSAVKIENCKLKIENSSLGINVIEKLAFKLQYLHMKNRISREVVTPTRAIFHPQDWGKVVLSRLNKIYGIL